MSKKLNIAIAGIAGRMGRQLLQAALDAGHTVSGGSEAPGSPLLGNDIGPLVGQPPTGTVVSNSPDTAAQSASVWIDFTIPAVTLKSLQALREQGVGAVVIGTTGFTPEQEAEIEAFANDLAIVKAGNFSLGVNLLQALVRQAASRLGTEWDIEILETHHSRKVDAPSGTALMLGDAAAEGRGTPLSELRAPPYDGAQAKRNSGEIGFSVRRSGGVIGDHDVTFGSDMEMLTLSHRALDRAVFATGAIKAAEWAVGRAPGLYGLDHVLGLAPSTLQ